MITRYLFYTVFPKLLYTKGFINIAKKNVPKSFLDENKKKNLYAAYVLKCSLVLIREVLSCTIYEVAPNLFVKFDVYLINIVWYSLMYNFFYIVTMQS